MKEKRREGKMRSIFGDRRLDKRLDDITETLSATPIATLSHALKEWANLKAGYRFMNNPNVTHEGIMGTERRATLQRLEADEGEVVLAVQDTTAFSFAGRKALSGLGVLEDNQTPGFFAHTTLMVSQEGVPLGVLDQQVWSRPQNLDRDKEAHKKKPITEKESFKWLQGLRHLPKLRQRVITVCDREADIYELFQDAVNHERDFIVRVCRDRRLEDATLLYDPLGEISAADTYTITVHRQVNQAERQAVGEIRYVTVTLRPPKRAQSAQAIPLEPLRVQVVEVREVDAPPDVKEPIHWRLMTTLPVESLDAA